MDKTPWDHLFDQIAELMQSAYDNASKPVDPKKAREADAKLDALEAKVREFKAMTDQIVADAGINDYTFNAMLDDKENLANSVLVRGEELKTEAKKGAQDVLKASIEAKNAGKKLSKKKEKKEKSPQARKGKFKSMGGFKDWKPL